MVVEFASIKKLSGSESGYQSWLNLVLGRKIGFIAGFFYFYVNIFFFVDLLPNVITYFLYTLFSDGSYVSELTSQNWFKPVISVASIAIFWVATWVSTKGPKWLSRLLSSAGYAGFALTILFVIAAIVSLTMGTVTFDGEPVVPQFAQDIDLSWAKIASMSWALQSLGGLC